MATEATILTKHSKDYFELMKSTESMSEEDLKKLSARYEGMYFNNVSISNKIITTGKVRVPRPVLVLTGVP